MRQLSLRIDDSLHLDLRRAAREHGLSINGYLTRVLEAALVPAPSEPELERIRARLVAAGLAEPVGDGAAAPTPSPEEFAAARRRSAGGTSGSQLIADQRGAR